MRRMITTHPHTIHAHMDTHNNFAYEPTHTHTYIHTFTQAIMQSHNRALGPYRIDTHPRTQNELYWTVAKTSELATIAVH